MLTTLVTYLFPARDHLLNSKVWLHWFVSSAILITHSTTLWNKKTYLLYVHVREHNTYRTNCSLCLERHGGLSGAEP